MYYIMIVVLPKGLRHPVACCTSSLFPSHHSDLFGRFFSFPVLSLYARRVDALVVSLTKFDVPCRLKTRYVCSSLPRLV